MSLDLNKLANKLDEALSNETSETLTKFLTDKRMSNYKQSRRTPMAQDAYYFRKVWHENVSARKDPVSLIELKSRTYAGMSEAKMAIQDEKENIIEAYEKGKLEANTSKSGQDYYKENFKETHCKTKNEKYS